MRDAFDTVNPVIAFIFFAFALVVPMLVLHPVLICVSFAAAAAWLFILKGGRAFFGYALKFTLPVMLLAAVLNPVFNHAGVTTLFYLRHNPITLESILYGAASAAMLGTVILWFACFNAIFSSDKLIYILGRLTPSVSLVVSMALRFVPLFSAQAKRIALAQRGADVSCGGRSILSRARNGLRIISALITWALESSVTTADSMRARGFGLHPRRSFSNYRFDRRDALCGGLIALGMLSTALAAAFRLIYVRYFPSFKMAPPEALFILFSAVYALTLFIPTIMNLYEAARWRCLRSKI